jgi:nucleotide-binding universal stress UspA family protein
MKILVSLDASKSAGKVLEFSCELAKRLTAQVTLFHVVTVPTEITSGMDPALFLEAGEKFLEEFKLKAEKLGVKASTHVDSAYGNPAHRIVEYAKNGDFDLVALGAMGHSEIRDVLLGSVAQTVSRHAECPVLIVR